jgi:gamma-glutamylcyclotransferase
MLAPDRLSAVAPEAQFRFIAHLPETKLVFPLSNGKWSGALPSVTPEPGNTVWGAVFEIPASRVSAIDAAELSEGRRPTHSFQAVDREGKRHEVLTHVHDPAASNGSTVDPSRDYMGLIVAGGRHWGLPTGWVAGLEEYVEDPLF